MADQFILLPPKTRYEAFYLELGPSSPIADWTGFIIDLVFQNGATQTKLSTPGDGTITTVATGSTKVVWSKPESFLFSLAEADWQLTQWLYPGGDTTRGYKMPAVFILPVVPFLGGDPR